jgi:Zn-dependent protease with chaperone function
MKTIINIGMFLIIPVITILVTNWYIYDIEQAVQEEIGIGFSELCEIQEFDIQSICEDEYYEVNALRTGAIYTSVAAIGLVLLFQVAALVCGTNRDLLSTIFPKIVPIVLLGVAAVVLIQAFMLTYATYWIQILLISAWYPIVTGGIGVAGAIASFSIILAVWNSFKVKDHVIVSGHLAKPDEQSRLFDLIESVAKTIGGKVPDNIVFGLDPTFYAISNPVKIANQDTRLTGETMYLSLPLLRVLSIDEIKAIIGHELGHFAGSDTDYSRKFSPVYRSISESQQRMMDSENITTLPAAFTLMNLLNSFDSSVKSIGRERELVADEHGANASSGEALVVALLKLSIYSSAWTGISEKVIKRIRNGFGYTKNISWLFQSVVEHNIKEDTVYGSVEMALADSISHPNDSHPTTSSRSEHLGIDIAALEKEKFLLPQETAESLIFDTLNIEEELTSYQQLFYKAIGIQEGESDNQILLQKIVCMFATYITLADGVIDAEEINAAEAIGSSLFDDFDYFIFREYCHYPDSMVDFEELLNIASNFKPDFIEIIIDMCSKISDADGEISSEEKVMLEKIRLLARETKEN